MGRQIVDLKARLIKVASFFFKEKNMLKGLDDIGVKYSKSVKI